MGDIAITGIDCLFPRAHGVDAYWELLLGSGDAIGAVPPGRWDPAAHPEVARGGFADGIDVFDHAFFAVPPREAAAMDPHQRLLLPCVWRAIEDSGISPAALAGSDTGVYVGVMGGEWGRLTLSGRHRPTPQLGAGSSTGMIANRVSYHLDLHGPSLAVDTACSSSLVAVHLAVGALLTGECSTAVAAGVNLVLSPTLGLVYQQLGLAAPDGRCKPFAGDADGIGRADGVGAVVLRRLEDAVADGSRVYAVIRGSAVNQDGRSNGVTAPSRWSQQKVLQAAYRRAGVTPDRVRFVEAHGTGTVLGDAIECAALGAVHGVRRAEPCAIGSVKGNLGHTEGAAGIAGLIKAALALHHRIVPTSRHAERENPRLRLAERGLRLLKSPLRLPRGETVAGVSSFGMGGTNAHVVLASSPAADRPGRASAGSGSVAGSGAVVAGHAVPRAPGEVQEANPVGVFTLTADSAEGLRRNLAAQAAAVGRYGRSVAGLCWSSNRAKTGLPYRYAVTARDAEELAATLRRAAEAPAAARAAVRPSGAPVVGFLFTGQGSPYPGMTAGLYRDLPVYRRHLDEADAALAPHTGHSVRELLLAGDERITGARLAQPALFAVGYALSRTLTGLGVRPAAVLGHSVGEYAAAVTAGALGLADAARLVATRAALMAELPDGTGMMAVRGARDRVDALLAEEPELALAVVNGPDDTVLSGSRPALERAAAALTEQGLRARFLHVPLGFHSPAVAPVLPRLREAAAGVAVRRPEVPFASTRYGRLLRDEPLDAGYWAAQAAEPVLFADALGALMRQCAPTHLLELGPRPQLLGLAGRGGFGEGVDFLHPCPGPAATGRELADVVAALYRAGLDPDWSALYAPEHRRTERLAPYVFDDRPRFPQAPVPVAGAGDAVAPVQHSGDEPAERRTAPEADRSPVVDAVVRAVADVGGYPVAELTAAARFYEDLGFDSVMIMQLKDRIEARLPQLGELSVPDLIPALRSIESLAAHLRGLPPAAARVPATAGAGGE